MQRFCADLDQWPGSWAYEERDIPSGQCMVECFKPFLRELPALPLSRKTLRRHRDNIWVLGGEVIRQLQMDSGLRRLPIKQVVLSLIGDDGGPLLSHGQSDAEQRSFDATCRKLFRFLTDRRGSRGLRNAFKRYTRQRPPWYRPEDYEHMLDGLRKAGWQA